MMNYGDKDDIEKRSPGSRMWPSDGSYFRRGTLKPLAKHIRNYEVEEGDFSEALVSGMESKSGFQETQSQQT